MIFGYSISQAKKAVVSAVFLAGAVLALVLNGYDPSFTEAVIALVGPVFATIGVFMAKNHTPDDLQKALEQLKGAALAIIGYFTVVPTDTTQKATVLVGAVASVVAVYWTRNDPEVS